MISLCRYFSCMTIGSRCVRLGGTRLLYLKDTCSVSSTPLFLCQMLFKYKLIIFSSIIKTIKRLRTNNYALQALIPQHIKLSSTWQTACRWWSYSQRSDFEANKFVCRSNRRNKVAPYSAIFAF